MRRIIYLIQLKYVLENEHLIKNRECKDDLKMTFDQENGNIEAKMVSIHKRLEDRYMKC
jgi:hypothetical protein